MQSRNKISDTNKFRMAHADSILRMFQAILTDFVNLNPSYRRVDSARDFKTITTRFNEEGLGYLSVTLPGMMSDLFQHTQGGRALYTGFKKTPGAEYPAFLGRLFKSVYDKDENEVVAYSQIYQVCTLFKKLRGPFEKSLLRKEIRSFLKTEQEIGSIDFRAEPLQPILENSRKLIETVFEDVEFKPGDLIPRPGPGATNTPVDKHLRFRPHVVYEHLDEEFDFLETFYTHSWDPVEDARRYMNLPTVAEPYSRFKFIQKYLGKPRGICIEENEMQFFQQAIKRFLYDHLERHPATRGRVNFRSQDVNRSLALSSSIDNDKITIDMSEASNRVARELVYRNFWNTPLFHLLDTVSTRLMKLPDGTTHYTQMYAPMGSGVCFPIMAIIHWALIRSIIKLSSVEDSENLSKQVYVYGDDIIIPRVCAQAVYDYLPLFGMKLNVDKSFSNGPFRESCGIHAYMGVDITPVYVNRITETNQSDSNTNVLLSLIAKEAQFYNKGFIETSQCIQNLVRKHYWLLPTVGKDSPLLGWKREGRTEMHVLFNHARSWRYNIFLHAYEFNLQTVVPRRDPVQELDAGDSYLRKLITNADDAHVMPGRVEDLMVRRTWQSETAC
jgi:hypothetical protein